ncbi:MAG: thiamine phosphate synthase [Deltaproteobacteria bacterium]|nr:thiamine phosphate synthase [Deltaproteobacteria bacterium]
MGVYLVTDRQLTADRDVLRPVRQALDAGVRSVQLREKDMPPRELFYLARRMRELTSEYGATLLINDRVDIAIAVGADGVHLGQKSMPPNEARTVVGPGMLIGVSAHGLTEALAAVGSGADFITLGPIFHTESKVEFGEPLGVEKLKTVCASVNAPVYAIGGIKREHISGVMLAGAAGIAVISAVMGRPDVRASAVELVEEVKARRLRRVSE